MRVERLKPENVNVLENFVNEVGEELNIKFLEEPMIPICRGLQRGVKYKYEEFETPFYHSLSVGYNLSFIPFSEDTIELFNINVNDRGKGFGSELLSRIMDVSDRTGIKIKLVPVDCDRDKNTSKNYLGKLREWYLDMGFEKPKFPSIDPYYTYSPSVEEYKLVG
jgi:hypothetical protein